MTVRQLVLLCAPVVALFLGCGGGGGSAGENPWVGNWTRAGTQSTTCGGQSATTQLNGVVIISAGTASNTIDTLADNCMLVWDVSGSKGTVRPGQMCTVTIGTLNVTVTVTQGTVTLTGSTMAATLAGSTNNLCSFMQQTMLTKM